MGAWLPNVRLVVPAVVLRVEPFGTSVAAH